MRKIALVAFLLSLFTAYADTCPKLEGIFQCRTADPFQLKVEENTRNGITVYKLTDPTGSRDFVADGQFHEVSFRTGKGEYKAACESNSLLIEAHPPSGELLLDRYYIERAAIVRVRLNKTSQKASSFSCAPTQGTWKLYPH